jgi:competence protein ComEC
MVPLTSVLLFPGFLLSLLPFRLNWMAWLAEKLTGFCYGSVRFFDGWTLPDHPHAGPMLLGVLVAILLVQAVGRNAVVQKLLVLTLLVLNLGWYFLPFYGRQPRAGAYFLDVGQGDCAALIGQGGHAVVVDAGTMVSNREQNENDEPPLENAFLARNVVSRALWEAGVRQIDAIFVSHLHADHISAVGRLARNFRAKWIFLSPSAGLEPVFARFVQTLPISSQMCFISAGRRWAATGLQTEVLYPPPVPASFSSNANENSLVVRAVAGSRTFLFTGDMSAHQERILLGKVGCVDVLKVAHHGSASATSPPWLEELRPRIAVISAGQRNLFGHPHPVTLERLKEKGIEVHRTDQEGYFYLRFQK